jgi:Zn ribbon nucleic-acid-binding protein
MAICECTRPSERRLRDRSDNDIVVRTRFIRPALCPFCANSELVKIWADDPNGDGEGTSAFVLCGNCLAQGPVMDRVERAMYAWNMRREVCRG